MKIKLGVFFGGKSVEHEVSIITAVQAMAALDPEKYEVIPIYITKDERLFTGPDIGNIEKYKDIPALLKNSVRILLLNDNGRIKLIRYPFKKFGGSVIGEIEVAMPLGHGTNVEDGALQGLLQSFGIAYTGCGVLSAACGMNKYTMKVLLDDAGIPVLPAVKLSSFNYVKDREKAIKNILDNYNLPVIVKPINLGSSIGVKIAHTRESLAEAIEHALLFSGEILIERAITRLREINVSVLGDSEYAEASECEEPISGKEILDFEEKYLSQNKKAVKSVSVGMSSLNRKIPALISSELREKIRELGIRAFQTLGCSGVARIDFMLDVNDGDALYLTEINTLPGSLSFYLWEPVGLKYKDLLDRLISLALKRKRLEQNVNFSFKSNILAGYNPKAGKGMKS
ncbi:MAG: D-alanine--D-alanine ligase [Eubacterium sp.]|jgi:D-alanine-D-alanine ligase|nr:D-alanine--D-alanine ligase [Eubacterium sp.]